MNAIILYLLELYLLRRYSKFVNPIIFYNDIFFRMSCRTDSKYSLNVFFGNVFQQLFNIYNGDILVELARYIGRESLIFIIIIT